MATQTRRAKAKRARASSTPPPGAKHPPTADLDLAERVVEALAPLSILGLVVRARAGTVRLEGTTRAERERQQASHLARTTPGVTSVINDIAVVPLEASITVNPAVLSPETAAETEESHLHFVHGTEFDFNELQGTIDVSVAAAEAKPYFPSTDPVVRTVSREHQGIEVIGGFSPTSLDAPKEFEQLPTRVEFGDSEIARKVRLALLEDAITADLPIHVVVRNGVVRLQGAVASLEDSTLAEAVASDVKGVVEVIDETIIEGM